MLQHIQYKNQEFAQKEKQIIESIIKYKSKTQQISNSQQFENESIQFSTQLTDTQFQTDQQNLQSNIQQQQQDSFLTQYQKQQQMYEELLQESSVSEFKYAALLLELNNVYQYLNQFQDPDSSQPSSWSTKVLFKENLHLKELQQQNVDYQKSVQQQLQIKDDHISQLKRQIAEIQKDSLSNLENYQKTVEAHQKLQEAHESAVAQNEFLQNEMCIIKSELCKYQQVHSQQETVVKHHELQEKYIQSTDEIVKLQQKLTQQQVQAQKENEMLVKRIMQVKEQNLQLQNKMQQLESGKKPKKDNVTSDPNNTKDIEDLIQQSNISQRYIEQLESQLFSTKNELKKQIDTREQLLQTNLQLVNTNQCEIKQYKVEITELKNKLAILNQQLSYYEKEAQYKIEELAKEKIQTFVAKDIKLDIEQLLIKQEEMNQIVEVQIQQINSLQLLVQQLKQQLFITSIQELQLENSSYNIEECKLISLNQ
ncbi:Hypothetical_protein [Hexamita inflata]|uniref:Hypothetical_protein n=1 Tax=Hexamita inflata TaxID=28002 RepID=A0AA86V4B4_9EUKA|nr:Hypothetical protein HINF_LOCUS58853 [Hexamita inflata]CAI9975971.1 Hypothetical protein HINF_LOCUS63616 [Hexamita inflata]